MLSNQAVAKTQAIVIVILVVGAVLGLGTYYSFLAKPTSTTPSALTTMQSQTSTGGANIDLASREGKLMVYHLVGWTGARVAQAAHEGFQKKYPEISVEAVSGSTVSVIERFTSETLANKHTADVIVLEQNIVPALWQHGPFLMEYRSPQTKGWPSQYLDPEGRWASVGVRFIAIGWNTKLVEPKDAPKKTEDLLNPMWKGKMTLPSSTVNWYITEKTRLGDESMKRLASQQPIIARSFPAVAEDVAAGKALVGLGITFDSWLELKLKGAPVDYIISEPAIVNSITISISKNSPHPNAAKLYVDYMLSKEGQMLLDSGGYTVPLSPDLQDTAKNKFPKNLVTAPLLQTTVEDVNKAEKEFNSLFILQK